MKIKAYVLITADTALTKQVLARLQELGIAFPEIIALVKDAWES